MCTTELVKGPGLTVDSRVLLVLIELSEVELGREREGLVCELRQVLV